jgi:hypothetical protein
MGNKVNLPAAAAGRLWSNVFSNSTRSQGVKALQSMSCLQRQLSFGTTKKEKPTASDSSVQHK